MKKVKPGKAIAFILLMLASSVFYPATIFAQDKQPVSWSFYSRQIAPDLFEVHTIATIKEGWKFFHQTSVEVAPSIGNRVFFANNNVVFCKVIGSTRTVATMGNEVPGTDTAHSYESTIHFVHLVKLKQLITTDVAGEISYTICNIAQHQLLQEKITFSILLLQ